MDAFRQAKIQSFELKLAHALRDAFPARHAGSTDEDVREYIRSICRRALSLGLGHEEHIARFAFLDQMLGSEFEQDVRLPWVAEILNDTALPEAAKMQLLTAYTECEVGADFVPMSY